MNPYRPNTNLFGQQPQQGQQPNTTGNSSGIFGQPNTPSLFGQQQTTPSMFGQPAGAAAPFGQPASAPAPLGQQPGMSMPFGQQPSAASPFGQPAPASAPFGQATGGSLPFGQPTGTAPSLFGQPAGGAASSGPFGASSAARPTGSFGAPTQQSLFSAPSSALASSGSASTLPFGSSGAAPFPSTNPTSSSMFGANLFNQPSSVNTGAAPSSTPGQASLSTPFGSGATAPNPFGQATASSLPAPAAAPGQATAPSALFGQNSTGAFGQAGAANLSSGQSTLQPNVAAAQAPSSSTPFGQGNATSFFTQPSLPATSGASPFGQPAGSVPLAPAINAQPAHPASAFQPSAPKPSESSAFAATPAAAETAVDQSCLMSSIKDNSVNLYNLKLKEIIDMQVDVLDRNIKEFRKEVRTVFERDMQLIKAKNAFVEQQKNIEREKAMMDELSGLLDHLEKELDGLPVGTETAMGGCVAEFENICDRFYRVVENLQDEQGETMDILNENYELIAVIDKKLDALEGYSAL